MPYFLKPSRIEEGTDSASALLHLAETTGLHTSLDTLLPIVVELTSSALCCQACMLSLWDDTRACFIPAASHGLPPDLESLFFSSPIALGDIPLLDEVVRRRLAFMALADDPSVPEAFRRFANGLQVKDANKSSQALLGMPLLHRKRIIGGILVIADKGCLGPREVKLITGIARQVALVIASARALEEEQRRRCDLETLQETIALLTAELDLETLYQRIVQRVALTFGASGVALYLWDENHQPLPPSATFGLSDGQAQHQSLPLDLVRDMLKSHPDLRPFMLPNPAPLPLRYPDLATAEGDPIVLVIPLQRGDRFMGLVTAYQDSKATLDDDALALAQALAHQTVIALDNAQLYTALRAGRERLRALSSRLTQAQEAERTRIARELHDEAGQALTTVRLQLDFLASVLPHDLPAQLRQQMEEAQTLVGRTIEEIRRISIDLRPSLLDDLGLAPALRWQCDRLSRHSNMDVRFTSRQETRRLDSSVETAVYRAAQEALTNIARHAHATIVDVSLDHRADRLYLSISDDGQGFSGDADQGIGLGLLGMQERLSAVGGTVHITSRPGSGTTLRIEVPLEHPYAPQME
jgi:signal transduction histidine kinase